MKTQQIEPGYTVAPKEQEDQRCLAFKAHLESQHKETVEMIKFVYSDDEITALYGLLDSDEYRYYKLSFQKQSLSMEIRGTFSDYKIACRKKLRKKS